MVRRQRRTGLLDDRARVILAALVEEHIRTATPVGSIALSDGYDLGVSPATVRGVLVELEEEAQREVAAVTLADLAI